MIRAESIKKLVGLIVVENLKSQLETSGYKYIKTQDSFKKTKGDFILFISLQPTSSPLEFNEEDNELYLNFTLSAELKCPNFDKWVMSKLKEQSNFRHTLTSINGIAKVDQKLLSNEDFYVPSKSQAFKSLVTRTISGFDSKERIDLRNCSISLTETINALEKLTQVSALFQNRTQAYRDYYRLLVFDGQIALATTYYQQSIDELSQKIVEQINSSPEDTKRSIQALERYSIECKTLLNLDIESNFKRSLQIKDTKHRRIKLANDLGFIEVATFDTAMVNLDSFAIDDEGNTCSIIDHNKIVSIDRNGQTQHLGMLTYPECYQTNNIAFKIKWNQKANAFICNNYIIRNFKLYELPLPIPEKNAEPQSIYPLLSDIEFGDEDSQFYTLFNIDGIESIFSVFDQDGNIIETKKLKGNCKKINIPRREIFALNKDNSYTSIDFNGEIIHHYPFGNGNEKIALSPDGEKVIFHSYSTKSQYYNMEKNNKETLWAHPTYLKEYKERFYSDIHHNFGMTYCKFSSDNKFIVGGADHGKYVIWDGDGRNRKELIPCPESRTIFNYNQTQFKEGKSIRVYFTPYTVELDSQQFFINRGYSINQIDFIDNHYIITKVQDALLTWDYNANSIGYVTGIEKCVFSPEKYLALQQNNELGIFKRVEEIQEGFESSAFKEIEKIESKSNITHMPVSEKDSSESISLQAENNVSIAEEPHKKRSWFEKVFKRKNT